jgi:EmrB/QacA subfamily drug resistance transporter
MLVPWDRAGERPRECPTKTIERRQTLEHAPKRTHYQLSFAVILAGITAFSLLQSLVNPVLWTIQHDLHTSQSTVTWVFTGYLLSAAVATPIGGRLGDMIGKKKVLIATLAALAVGSLVAALATSIGVTIVARVIQGVGGAVLPLSFGIIRDEFPRERVTSAIGIAAALLAVGGGAGLVLAGPIVNALNYHFLFWIPLILVILAAVGAFVILPESRVRTPGQISWAPAVLLSGWLVALLLAVSEGQSWGWLSGRTVVLAAGAVVLAVAWVFAEVRSAHPLIEMRMMRIPAVWTTNLVALLFGAGMYSIFAFLPQFLQTPRSAGYGFGASITASGLFLLPATVTMFTFGILSGRVAARIGSKLVLTIGSLMSVAPFALLAFAHTHQWEIYVASSFLGAGFGFAFAAMSNLIVEAVPANQVGAASGMNANIRTIGGSLGASVMASIVTSGAAANGLPRESGYTHGFASLMIAVILATLACFLIPRARRNERAVLEVAPAVEHAETALVAGATLVDAR